MGRYSEGAVDCVETQNCLGAVGGDGSVFEVHTFRLSLLTLVSAGCGGAGLFGLDPVDGYPSEVAEDLLVVYTAQCGVVDDCLAASQEWLESGETFHGHGGFATGFRDVFGVEDYALVYLGSSGGYEHVFGSPGCLAGSLPMQSRIRLHPRRC